MRSVIWIVSTVAVAAATSAAPFAVPVDPGQSLLNFQLCLLGRCDTDSSAVSGSITIELATVDNPQALWVYDFHLYLTDNLHWYLSWGILGSLTADATGLSLHYAEPGVPLGPAPVLEGNFTLSNVPTNADGVLTYHAVGVPCAALQQAGYPCDDTIDVAEGNPYSADQFSGTVTSQNRVVTLTSNPDVTVPVDPNNPNLGSMRAWGTVRGSVYVPPYAPGDLNCDRLVNVFDIDPFVLALSDPAGYAAAYPTCEIAAADVNGDGQLNAFDIDPFVELLTGP
jgi:hypothetical protein